MRYLLYNPHSGRENNSYEDALSYQIIANMTTKLVNIAKIYSMSDFLETLEPFDDLVIFGGDGTLNRFVNDISDIEIKNDIYFYPSGTGNDFARDLEKENESLPFLINNYIKNLPTVTVKGRKRKFINGVGFGIDGYCCEVGDKLKAEHKKPNYATIAIKGLLFHFKPVNAKVSVDGCDSFYKRVWIAPTMLGRFYGGGMMPTPEQNRSDEDKNVSVMIFHGTSKLKTLMIFPSLFKGEHVKYKNNISILKGKNIAVSFDRPTPLQIDGETVLDVADYSVEASNKKGKRYD